LTFKHGQADNDDNDIDHEDSLDNDDNEAMQKERPTGE
jgi:hypothetical protein